MYTCPSVPDAPPIYAPPIYLRFSDRDRGMGRIWGERFLCTDRSPATGRATHRDADRHRYSLDWAPDGPWTSSAIVQLVD